MKWHLNLLLFFLPGLTFSQVTDSIFVYKIVKESFKNCEAIVEGQVLSYESYWNLTKDSIYTSYNVHVDNVKRKGNIKLKKNNLIEVIIEGGQVDDVSGYISHNTVLYVGEKCLILLKKANWPINPNSEIHKNLHFEVHDGITFEYDFKVGQLNTFFSGNKFEVKYLYGLIDE